MGAIVVLRAQAQAPQVEPCLGAGSNRFAKGVHTKAQIPKSFLSLAQNDRPLQYHIDALLAIMLGLNLAGMLLSEFIVRFLRLTTLEIVGFGSH